MTEHIPYPTKMRQIAGHSALTPAQEEANRAWEREELAKERAQVQGFAVVMSQRAYEEQTAALEAANEAYDFLADVQRRAQERRVESSPAVSALKEAEARLTDLRQRRQRVSEQMAQATYLNERPHEYVDELFRRFPGIGDRPLPPFGQMVRGI